VAAAFLQFLGLKFGQHEDLEPCQLNDYRFCGAANHVRITAAAETDISRYLSVSTTMDIT
jgi:hypothetical protein